MLPDDEDNCNVTLGRVELAALDLTCRGYSYSYGGSTYYPSFLHPDKMAIVAWCAKHLWTRTVATAWSKDGRGGLWFELR